VIAERGGDRTRSVAYYMDSAAWPGGAETWLTHLMLGVLASGWSVTLFLTDRRASDDWAGELRSSGIEVARVRPPREIDPAAYREALRLFRGVPLVHFNKAHPRACLPVIPAARRAGARGVVSSEHVVLAPRSRYPLGAAAVRRLVRRANDSVDVITVPSDASRSTYLASYGADESKVVTVRGAVDLVRFETGADRAAVRDELRVETDASVAAVVGRLCEGKGLATALRIVRLVAERVPRFRLVIVGGGPLEERLLQIVRDEELTESVRLVGPRDDVPRLLLAVDLLLVASESETAGLSALEGMAAGLPVVATAVGGLTEAVEPGVTGLLVPPGDPRALADAVVEVLTHPELARELGARGRDRVASEFSTEKLVARMTSIYEELLDRSEA